MTVSMSDMGDNYARIFGEKDPIDSQPGARQRKCKVCGGWHRLDAWPHNCAPERPPRSTLAAPRLHPTFEPFVAGTFDAPEVINDRRDKRNYMDKHDLVEYDRGVTPDPEPTKRQWIEDFAQDFNRAVEEDPLNRPPTEKVGQTDLEDAPEIITDDIEVSDG